jgi:hypothetical protein
MFCSQCGAENSGGSFCTQCGAEIQSGVVPTQQQLVDAEILVYVDENWSEDFSDFLSNISNELAMAREILSYPLMPVNLPNLNSIERVFSEFISGGGFPPDTKFDSLQHFVEEME